MTKHGNGTMCPLLLIRLILLIRQRQVSCQYEAGAFIPCAGLSCACMIRTTGPVPLRVALDGALFRGSGTSRLHSISAAGIDVTSPGVNLRWPAASKSTLFLGGAEGAASLPPSTCTAQRE